jgi:FAD:protein FMN transferase
VVERVEHVMGMPVRIAARGSGRIAAAVADAFDWLRWVDATFSTYDPASEIARIGRGELETARAHPHVRAVLARCERLRVRTGGAFDPWALPGARPDPSGLVKGWAAERAAALLLAAGARDLMVDAGGDVCVRGEPAPGRPWRIGVRHPLRRDRVAAVVELRDGAVATSGAYERGGHVFDPRTRRPAAGALSVTVTGPDLGTADAYATAAFALGADAPAWAAALPGYGALTLLPDGRAISTAGFRRRCPGGSVTASLRAQSAKRSVKIWRRETPERSSVARVAAVIAGGPQT